MPGGKCDVVSCRHARRSPPATPVTKHFPEKYRDELTHCKNYPRPCLLFKTAIQAGRGARQGVRFEIDTCKPSVFRGCKATASCEVEMESTIAILEINRKVEASPRCLDSLELF